MYNATVGALVQNTTEIEHTPRKAAEPEEEEEYPTRAAVRRFLAADVVEQAGLVRQMRSDGESEAAIDCAARMCGCFDSTSSSGRAPRRSPSSAASVSKSRASAARWSDVQLWAPSMYAASAGGVLGSSSAHECWLVLDMCVKEAEREACKGCKGGVWIERSCAGCCEVRISEHVGEESRDAPVDAKR